MKTAQRRWRKLLGIVGGVFCVTVAAASQAPVFTVQPQSQVAPVGRGVVFAASASGATPMSYQWFFNGAAIPLATGTNFVLSSVSHADSGAYWLSASNSHGTAVSSNAVLSVVDPPAIVKQPVSQGVLLDSNAVFTVQATGTAPLSYQWRLNGHAITGATNSVLALTAAAASDAGTYTAIAINPYGNAESAPATLTVYLTSAATLSVRPGPDGNPLQIDVTGVPGLTYALQASTNLSDWTTLLTSTLPIVVVDATGSSARQRFYRAVCIP